MQKNEIITAEKAEQFSDMNDENQIKRTSGDDYSIPQISDPDGRQNSQVRTMPTQMMQMPIPEGPVENLNQSNGFNEREFNQMQEQIQQRTPSKTRPRINNRRRTTNNKNQVSQDNGFLSGSDRLELTCKTLRISELAEMQKGSTLGRQEESKMQTNNFDQEESSNASPMRTKNLVMPSKTEVISLFKGVETIKATKNPAALYQNPIIKEEVLPQPQVNKSKTPKQPKEKKVRIPPVAKQPLKPKTFQVPIQRQAAQESRVSPSALESIFGGNKPKNMATEAATRWRTYSPDCPQNQEVGFTAEQLFKVFQEQTTPDDILQRQIELENQTAAERQISTTQSKPNLQNYPKRRTTQIDVSIVPQKQITSIRGSLVDHYATVKSSQVGHMSPLKSMTKRMESFTLASEEAFSPGTVCLNSFKRRSNNSLSIISSQGRHGDQSPLKIERFAPIYDEQNRRPNVQGMDNKSGRDLLLNSSLLTASNKVAKAKDKSDMTIEMDQKTLNLMNGGQSNNPNQQSNLKITEMLQQTNSNYANIKIQTLNFSTDELNQAQQSSSNGQIQGAKKIGSGTQKQDLKNMLNMSYGQIINVNPGCEQLPQEILNSDAKTSLEQSDNQVVHDGSTKLQNNSINESTMIKSMESLEQNYLLVAQDDQNAQMILKNEHSSNSMTNVKNNPPSKKTCQKIAPRSILNSQNNVLHQVSPRDFNQQIFAGGKKARKQSDKRKIEFVPNRRGYQPIAGTQSRSKREQMQKLAGLQSIRANKLANLNQAVLSNQEVEFGQSAHIIIDTSKMTPSRKNSGTEVSIIGHEIIPDRFPLKLASNEEALKKLATSTIQEESNESRQAESKPTVKMNNSEASPNIFKFKKTKQVDHDETASFQPVNECTADALVLEKIASLDAPSSALSQDEIKNIKDAIDLRLKTEGDILSRDNNFDTGMVQRSQQAQDNNDLSMNNRRSGTNQPILSKLDPMAPMHTSISIHQSSCLDGESSYQTQRLTPMEIKLNNNNWYTQQSQYDEKQRQSTQQRLKPRLKLGILPRNSGNQLNTNAPTSPVVPHLALQRDKLSTESPGQSPTMSVQIQLSTLKRNRMKNHKNAPAVADSRESGGQEIMMQMENNSKSMMVQQISQETDVQVMQIIDGSPSNNEDQGRKQKVFLRQVYTNMQKVGKQNRHYQKFKQNYKAELSNQYRRRKLVDNEWQFRLLKSKLQQFDTKKVDDESMIANYTTTSNEFNMTELNNISMVDQPRNLSTQVVYKEEKPGSFDSVYKKSPRLVQAIGTQTLDNNDIKQLNGFGQIMFGYKAFQNDMQQKSDIADSIGSQVSFNPLQYQNIDRELKPRVRERHSDYQLTSTISQPDQSTKNEAAKHIVTNSPGSNAYLDHVRKRIKLKSQGQGVRPQRRNLDFRSLKLPSQNQQTEDSLMIEQSNQASLTNRSQIKTSEVSTRREVLRLDYAAATSNEGTSFAQNINSAPVSRRGLRTTRNSFVPQMDSDSVFSPRDVFSLGSQFGSSTARQQRGNPNKTGEVNKPVSFVISQAKPSLFKPLNANIVKIESYVQASQVANQITKPGEPYQTTRSLAELNQSLHQRSQNYRRLYATSQYDDDEMISQSNAASKKDHKQAISFNRQVSEQNRSLRRKAFSFTKSVNKRDIRQIAKNLDKLNKTTRDQFFVNSINENNNNGDLLQLTEK